MTWSSCLISYVGLHPVSRGVPHTCVGAPSGVPVLSTNTSKFLGIWRNNTLVSRGPRYPVWSPGDQCLGLQCGGGPGRTESKSGAPGRHLAGWRDAGGWARQGGGAETLDGVGVGLGSQPAGAGWVRLARAVGVVCRGSCRVTTASLCTPPLPGGAGLPVGTLCLNRQVCWWPRRLFICLSAHGGAMRVRGGVEHWKLPTLCPPPCTLGGHFQKEGF